MRSKWPRLSGKPERREALFDAVLQQLERGIGDDTSPQHMRPAKIWEHAKAFDLEDQRASPAPRGLLQRGSQLALPRIVDLSQEFETEVNVVWLHPLHGKESPHWRERIPEA